MMVEDPAFDYDNKEHKYSTVRKADARIQKYVEHGLQGMNTILNIGAGTGSYELDGKYIISVEPSEKMRLKRLELGRNPALNAKADSLPFDNNSFDATLAVLTIHHWPSLENGLKELVRVSKHKIVILTYDPEKLDLFWNIEYFPEVIRIEQKRYPALLKIQSIIGRVPNITNIKIPIDCTDGFQEAFYARPEEFLVKEVRQSQSAWGFLSNELENKYVEQLREELENGEWERKYGFHRTMQEFDGAYRMLEFDLTSSSNSSVLG